MKRYSQQQIGDLLDKFMNGLTSLEEEAALADYFRTHEVPREWEDYRLMFGYFDRGMEGELLTRQAPVQPITRQMGRRWWGIVAAACITAAIVGTVVLHRPTTTTVPEISPVASNETAPIGETQDVASLQTTPEQPEETQNLASHKAKRKSTQKSQRRLQAENARLARENERLQRELADLKRRAFIIDLEANGFRAVQDEDGSIVLIDLEQELENELNNQPTTNIPAI